MCCVATLPVYGRWVMKITMHEADNSTSIGYDQDVIDKSLRIPLILFDIHRYSGRTSLYIANAFTRCVA